MRSVRTGGRYIVCDRVERYAGSVNMGNDLVSRVHVGRSPGTGKNRKAGHSSLDASSPDLGQRSDVENSSWDSCLDVGKLGSEAKISGQSAGQESGLGVGHAAIP